MKSFKSRLAEPVGASEDVDRSGRDRATLRLIVLFASLQGLHSQWRRSLDLNAHEGIAMLALWYEGPMTMSDLGERIPLSRAAVTSLTDRLESRGFVKRVEDAHDRRRTVLTPSIEPARMTEALWQTYSSDIVALASEFSDSDWATITRFLGLAESVSSRHATALRERHGEELAAMVRQQAT